MIGTLFAASSVGIAHWGFWVALLGILFILVVASGIDSVIGKHKILYDNAFPTIWLFTGILLTLHNVRKDSPDDYFICHLHISASFFMIIVHCLKWKRIVSYFCAHHIICIVAMYIKFEERLSFFFCMSYTLFMLAYSMVSISV